MNRKRKSDASLEKAVLGAAMRKKETFAALAKIIRKPEVFLTYANQCVWKAFLRMARNDLPFDLNTTADTLHKLKMIGDVKPVYLAEIWQDAPTLDVTHHAKTLVDLYQRRETLLIMQRLSEDVGDEDISPVAILEKVKAEFESVASIAFAGDDEDQGDGGKKFTPFPVDALPSSLQDFILAAAEALYCDPTFVAIPCLVAVGAAIGNSRLACIKGTWQEPSVFWAATIADSSSMKSPAQDFAIAPLWLKQGEMSKRYELDCQRFKQELEEFNAKRYDRSTKGYFDGDERKPTRPAPAKLLVSDVTIEKLASVLYENPMGVCLVRDELAGWFASFGRYSDGKGPSADMPMWLEIFRAKGILIDRKTADPPSIFVERAACSVVGTIQPKILKRILTDDFFDSGLASRLLVAMPPRRNKVWTENIIPEEIHDAYSRTVRDIYEGGSDILEANGNRPRHVQFSKAGKTSWIEFYSEWADRQSNAEGEHSYALAKLEAYCARFAMLLCVYEKLEISTRREEMGEGHVKRAFRLVNWFASEAERVYSMCREPAEQLNREKLVEFIRAIGGEIDPRRLLRSNPSKYRTMDECTRILEGLVEKKLGAWKMKTCEGHGGRPVRKFVISPDTIKT